MKKLIIALFSLLVLVPKLSKAQNESLVLVIVQAEDSINLKPTLISDDISFELVNTQDGNVYIDEKGKCRAFIPIPNSKTPKRVLRSNEGILIAGVASMGILYILPESVTNWDKDEITFSSLGKKWRENVKAGPVVDNDSFFLNYVMHPYFGSVYYMTLRGAGYEWWESALYSAGMSTFFWEYGIESFAEVPSWQDIIVTPVGGSGLGELLYQGKKGIKKNQDELLNSRVLGRTALVLIDPLNEFQDVVKRARLKKNNCASLKLNSNFSLVNGQYPGLMVRINFED